LSEAGAPPRWGRRRGERPIDLLGLGQISLDRVGAVSGWPPRGGKRALEDERELPGGQVATAVLAATKLGLRCALAGAVGDDEAAAQALAPLVAAGVDCEAVRRLPGARTRQAWVLRERASGERTVFERRDPALRLEARELPEAIVARAAILLVDAEHPEASLRAVRLAREAGTLSLCDVERADEASLAIAREVDFPIVSEAFADETSSGDCTAALRDLSGSATRMAVVTRGERGALALCGGRVHEVPALRIQALDTTGAGDVFRGAFAFALLDGRGAREALELACAAAGLGCLGRGAQGGLPDLAMVEARLRRA
jgi:sugar/nucleoside kinase (ribokinase family)